MNIKYRIIVKVQVPGGDPKFLKYNGVNNLLSFTKFLDDKHSKWLYFNVYDSDGAQVAAFQKGNRPLTKTI
jgi:hypothetical protein